MAARNLVNQQFAFERDTCKIYARGTGAAASALTGVKGKGVASITRTGAGAHTITLQDKWAGLLFLSGSVIDATTPDDWEVTIVSEDVDGAKTIAIACFKGGVAADLTTDEKLLLEITLSNSSQTPTGY